MKIILFFYYMWMVIFNFFLWVPSIAVFFSCSLSGFSVFSLFFNFIHLTIFSFLRSFLHEYSLSVAFGYKSRYLSSWNNSFSQFNYNFWYLGGYIYLTKLVSHIFLIWGCLNVFDKLILHSAFTWSYEANELGCDFK